MAQLRSVSSGTDVLSMSARSTRTALPYTIAQSSYVSGEEAESLIYTEFEQVVTISNGALQLLNGFLDQILYDILTKSQSTNVTALRAAIPSVLKQRLGRAAIKAADAELEDYLEEDELEDLRNIPGVLDPRAEFDVELAWKLTRLRCMVYAKLGDMEEEDEEDFLEGDDVRDHMAQVKEAHRSSARISPPAAIFLTTVLEFLAEQALGIAAQHAMKRNTYIRDSPRETALAQANRDTGLIPLEEIDMSGIGKEGPLIRLWRSWKGTIRLGGGTSSRPQTPNMMSPMGPESPATEWRFPIAPVIAPIKEESRSVTPANIPLPATEDNLEKDEESERGVGGIAGVESQRPVFATRTSTSMIMVPGQFPSSGPATGANQMPTMTRRRSRSVPSSPTLSSGPPFVMQQTGSPTPNGHFATGETEDQDQAPKSNLEHNRSSQQEAGIGATVATIAGALSVEAARAPRRDRQTEQARPLLSAAALGATSNADKDVHPTRYSLRAPNTTVDSTEEDVEQDTNDAEDLALSSSDVEAADHADEHTHLRDSGFGVGATEDGAHQQHHAADATQHHATTNQQETLTSGDGFTPSARSSNVGYATIFQTPGTSVGYDTSDSVRTSAVGMVRSDEAFHTPKSSTAATMQPSTSAWPAVIPNRRSSLEQKGPGQTDVRPLPPSVQSQVPEHVPEQTMPRFVTTTGARSRSGSANQHRPSTSGSGSSSAQRQHIRLRSEDQDAQPREVGERTNRSLDLLIDSDETLHYTLTPATVAARTKKTQAQELAEFFRETVPPGHELGPKSSRSGKDGLNGLRANPPGAVTTEATPSQPPVPSPSRSKKSVGEPREARMVRDNTRDLADYARSTGPENMAQLPKSLGPRPSTAQGTKADQSPRVDALGDDNRPNTGKPASRLKYQARDAKIPRTMDSSDLIDFIREGPPRAPGEHRIDRHVAPFRTTMDSDDLNALAPPPEVEGNGRNSEASVPESAMTIRSMPSSMNSRTGLLDSTTRAGNKPIISANAVSKQPVIPERDDSMPKRKQRRVRDPYAIDFSDEEDEMDVFQAPPKRKTDDELLVDFLRNTSPPPGKTTLPILGVLPGLNQPDASNMAKPSASSSKSKDFLSNGATGNKNNVTTNGEGYTNGADHGDTNETSNASRHVNIARASSPHLTQAGSKLDKYKPTTPTHAGHVDRNRMQSSVKGRVEPRGATSTMPSTGTSDLADFLKNSAPPAGMNEKPVQKYNNSIQKDQAGFMKFFQRRGSVRK